MTEKNHNGDEGEGGGIGGGGGGGGGGGSAAAQNMENANAVGDGGRSGGLHWLLPNIAEAMELLDGATVEEVQMKIEEITSTKFAKVDLFKGLENGAELGLFEVDREFSLNSDYLMRELKTEKLDRKLLATLVRKKLDEEKGKARMEVSPSADVKTKTVEDKLMWSESGRRVRASQKMCELCKKKINVIAESTSDVDLTGSHSEGSIDGKAPKRKVPAKRSAPGRDGPNSKMRKMKGQAKGVGMKKRQQPTQHPKKSKLLVERNPLDNEPPRPMFT